MNIFREITVELRELEPTSRSVKMFAGIIASFTVLAFWKWHAADARLAGLFAVAGSIAALAGFFRWRTLLPLYRAWMACAIVIGWFMLRLMLLLIYTCFIVPLSLVFWIIGKDPMRREWPGRMQTYWQDAEPQANNGRYLKKF